MRFALNQRQECRQVGRALWSKSEVLPEVAAAGAVGTREEILLSEDVTKSFWSLVQTTKSFMLNLTRAGPLRSMCSY